MNERIISLIGKENLAKINNTSVVIIGTGGVGGMALECLVRSGIKNITIIDHDVFEESNLNRQIHSLNSTLNIDKVDAAKKRCLDINPNLNIKIHNTFLNKNNINILDNHDYIIDACDSIDTKIEIIKFSKNKNIPLISSMGMGNRLDPSKVYITKLNKTENDPLAKKIRYLLREQNIPLDINVVASKELPIKSNIVTSMMMVPSTAGIYLTNYVINDIINC